MTSAMISRSRGVSDSNNPGGRCDVGARRVDREDHALIVVSSLVEPRYIVVEGRLSGRTLDLDEGDLVSGGILGLP